MLRITLVVAMLLLAGCCGRSRCNPCQSRCNTCQDRCNVCQPEPQPPPPPPGEGDTNCAVWATWDCVTNLNGPLNGPNSRPTILSQIDQLASVTPYYGQVMTETNLHRTHKNCKGNSNEGTPPSYPEDCARLGQPNCPCLLQALAAAQAGNWPLCIQKLQHGH